jgi:thymidylate kinase
MPGDQHKSDDWKTGHKRSSLISISGIDGSGKTTLCDVLNENLKSEGRETALVYGRYQPFILKPIFNTWRGLGSQSKEIKNYDEYNRARGGILSGRCVSGFFERLLVIDYIFRLNRKLRRALKNNEIVICDRYIYDTVAMDLAFLRNIKDSEIERILESVERRFPKPDVAVYLSVDEKTAISRKNDIPDIAYSKDSRRLYEKIAEMRNLLYLDGLIAPNENANKIIQELSKKIPESAK